MASQAASAGEGLRAARLLALLVPAALLGGAYIGQYAFGLAPCEMCWWQRYPHFVALVLALLAFAVPRPRPFVWLAATAILVSGLIGAFHAGVEYGWWQGPSACTGGGLGGGGLSFEDVMKAPVIRCDHPAWTLAGVSLAGFNFLFSTAGALAVAFLLAAGGRTRADTAPA